MTDSAQREPADAEPEDVTDLVKRGGGELRKAALPVLGAAVLAVIFIARARRTRDK
jgi:hypothetical protein